MKRIHLGHHFYGAGNLGDDFMLAGFLVALAPWREQVELTCCVPAGHAALAARFPEIRWLLYDDTTRQSAIADCDAWLGLGGSPFQCAVSRWFVDHLEGERRLCAAHDKPMHFLGVGGQDPAAYALPEIRAVCTQAEKIWTRDAITAESIAGALPTVRIVVAADLAHIFFAENPPPAAVPGRLTTVLNFDYQGWGQLDAALAALAPMPTRERVWLAQESRPLPGAERWLHERLPAAKQTRWRLQIADTGEPLLPAVLARWPSGEWLLASRFHATLAGAWAGSRIAVIAINEKLRAVAHELGCPALPPDAAPTAFAEMLCTSQPPARERLHRAAAMARQACTAWATAVGFSVA